MLLKGVTGPLKPEPQLIKIVSFPLLELLQMGDTLTPTVKTGLLIASPASFSHCCHVWQTLWLCDLFCYLSLFQLWNECMPQSTRTNSWWMSIYNSDSMVFYAMISVSGRRLRTQSFHNGQLLDDGPLLHHAHHAQRKGDRHHDGQALRDGSYRQAGEGGRG